MEGLDFDDENFNYNFEEDEFDLTATINAIFAGIELPENATKEEELKIYNKEVNSIIMKLQYQMEEVSLKAEETMQDIVLSVPALNRSMAKMEREADLLKQELGKVIEEISSLEKNNNDNNNAEGGEDDVIDQLLRLDIVKQNMTEVSTKLAKSASWDQNIRLMDEALNVGDLHKAAEQYQVLRNSIKLLEDLPLAEDREKVLHSLQNSLQKQLSPRVEMVLVDESSENFEYYVKVYETLGGQEDLINMYANNMSKQAPSNAQVIDCRGKAITPGWIDQHTHYDGQVTWDPYLSPSANCGVTTVLMGNCGIGFAPIRQGAKDRQFLLDLVDAVEDVPGAALNVGIDWSWETFPQYMNKLDSLDLAIDVAVLIGHAPVRAYVLGERANLSDLPGGPQNDEITKAEIDRMASIIEEAVAEGAMGFSTSRIILHRDKSGDLTPGTMAQEAEMLAIGRAIAAGGGGVFEGAFDFGTYDDVPRNQADKQKMELFAKKEWHWMSQVAKHYRVPFSFATDSNRVEMMRQFNMAENENLFYAQM